MTSFLLSKKISARKGNRIMGRLFGTDGARGVANLELTCETALNIGRAAASGLTREQKHQAKIMIGKDTRISSDMLESALTAGICSMGADAMLLGTIPTPGVAFLVREYNADAGIMISASHNPVEYNGIKIFNRDGFKLPDPIQDEIESIILDGEPQLPTVIGGELGNVTRCRSAITDYVTHVRQSIDSGVGGIKVAIDCANGSASATARELFGKLDANCRFIHCEPDGVNINKDCGSTHIDELIKYVRENRCQLGLAFDGDADRCLAVDEKGNLVDGDHLLAIFSKYLKKNGELNGNAVVGTVMSNMGLSVFARENDIQFVSTAVGDRYVLEEMLEHSYSVGGEQSGHIIFSRYATTGDGQLTGVQLLNIMKRERKPLSELAAVMPDYPQVLENVRINDRTPFAEDPEIMAHITDAEQALGSDGRVLVRASGTEPLIRVMLEGKDAELLHKLAADIADVIRKKRG